MMELSELTAQLQSKKLRLKIEQNYKLFFNEFPHVLRFTYYGGDSVIFTHIIDTAKKFLDESSYKVRRDWYCLNIYCNDPATLLAKCKLSILRRTDVYIGAMDENVIGEVTIKPELPRAHNVVIKNLPRDFRYRVFFRRSSTVIDQDSMNTIFEHINNDPDSESFSKKELADITPIHRYYGRKYFYTNNPDVLCLISLINARFIQRIERFMTLEEVNEKTTG